MAATTRNKRLLLERLSTVDERDQAMLPPALNLTLEMFMSVGSGGARRFCKSCNCRLESEYSAARERNQTSGGQRLVMLYTDGIENWPTQVVREFRDRQAAAGDDELVQLFGYSIGYGTGEIRALRWLACELGTYAAVETIDGVRQASRGYLDTLSRSYARQLISGGGASAAVNKRRISFSIASDAQAAGVVLTLSAPILDFAAATAANATTTDSSAAARLFAGVAGVDVTLERVRAALPNDERVRAFIIDNNGIVVWHTRLRLPPRELQALRRTACFSVEHKTSRAGSGVRVQFGRTNERVRRLMGLVDAVQTLDLLELESDAATPTLEAFRDAAMRGECEGGDRKFIDEAVSAIFGALIGASEIVAISGAEWTSRLSMRAHFGHAVHSRLYSRAGATHS